MNNSKKTILSMFPIFTIILLLFSCGTDMKETPANIIFIGGNIYTVDENNPKAEAVAIRNNRIIYVGNSKIAMRYMGDETKLIELNDRTMIPGMIDGHGHFMGMGNAKLIIDLRNAANFDEIISIVEKAVNKTKPGDWIIGRGWHQDKWSGSKEGFLSGFPTHHKLSEVSPNNPLMFRHASGHSSLVNAKALEIAGVNKSTVPEIMKTLKGGEIMLDSNGNPTGILNENAGYLVGKHVPSEKSKEKMDEIMNLAIQECHENGITSFHDAGVGQSTIDLFKEYKKSGKLKVRLHTMLYGSNNDLMERSFKIGPIIDTTDYLLNVRAVKLWVDGALGNRGAWLLEDYTDKHGWTGLETTPVEKIETLSNKCLENGFQLCIHAIGDRGNKEVLDAYEKAFISHPDKKDPRFRIEHAQHLNKDDIPRFSQLGVLASMQSIHMSSDRPWAIDRLGEERIIEGAYVWQKLLNSGATILNGTDVPVEPLNPLACFYAGVTRKTLKGTPENGYESDQKLTREQALKSYTLSAAYGSFEENVKGSIEVGKLADFAILDKDIMTIDEKEILNTKVVMTIFDGEIVYER